MLEASSPSIFTTFLCNTYSWLPLLHCWGNGSSEARQVHTTREKGRQEVQSACFSDQILPLCVEFAFSVQRNNVSETSGLLLQCPRFRDEHRAGGLFKVTWITRDRPKVGTETPPITQKSMARWEKLENTTLGI